MEFWGKFSLQHNNIIKILFSANEHFLSYVLLFAKSRFGNTMHCFQLKSKRLFFVLQKMHFKVRFYVLGKSLPKQSIAGSLHR
jgi:hypothetical protein